MDRKFWILSLIVFLLVGCTSGARAPLPPVELIREAVLDPLSPSIDRAVYESITAGATPGAVVLIGHRGRTIFKRAYGLREVLPTAKPMEVSTVFDIASLTKVMALAPSILILKEQGKIRLDDMVAKYIPEFGAEGKESVTIRQLLTHTSCFPPEDSLDEYEYGRRHALEHIFSLPLECEPGSTFIYSGLGYIVLGELVERVSGMDLKEFSSRYIFSPLGMKDTTFNPGWELRERAAPTEFRGGRWLKGLVEDPRAELLGGIAGHAGLFSTADDIAIFCQMILRGGTYNGKRVLSEESVMEMAKPYSPMDKSAYRGLGWDMLSQYSSPRGNYFPPGSFGHTGFSGTSIWIDPFSDTFIVILTNRVHPKATASINPLRRRIANIVAILVYTGKFRDLLALHL